MNILFDTHCHLCLDEFNEDLDFVIRRAFAQGVQYLLVPALDLRTSLRAIQISEKYPNIYAAIGFHPHTEGKWDSQISKEFEDLLHHPKVLAIGEIGLDQIRTEASLEEQGIRLRAFFEMALAFQKPVLLHNRGATGLLLKILRETIETNAIRSSFSGVFHAFGGNKEILEFAEQNHFYLGVGGTITFPKSIELQQMAAQILPLTVLETDSPVLSPIPYRGKRNEPSYLPIISKRLAELTSQSEEKVSQLTTKNAMSFLGIK